MQTDTAATALENANKTRWQTEKHDEWKRARKAARAARAAQEALTIEATNATLDAIREKTADAIERAAAAVAALEDANRASAKAGEAETIALREWVAAYVYR